MAYNDALSRLEALGNQTFKKKKKKQKQERPQSVTEKLNIMKGIGVEGPKPRTTLEKIIDKPLPTSTSDVRVVNVGKPNIPTKVTQTRLQDQFVPKTPSQQPRVITNVEAELRTQGLPLSNELTRMGIDPTFAAKHPIMAKAMIKVAVPASRAINEFHEETTPGRFLDRASRTAAELATGQPAGTYDYGKPRPTTGNKVLDIISDLAGTAGGFAAPGGIAAQTMAPSRAVTNIPKVAGTLSRMPERLAKPAERALTGLTGGATFGATTAFAEGGDAKEIAKSAAEDALIFGALDVGLPYFGVALKKFAEKTGQIAKPVGIRLRGKLAGKKIQPLDDFTIVSAKEPERLISEGWVEHRPGSGIWKKYDPETGELVDQYYETVVTMKVDPVTQKTVPEVTPKFELWRQARRTQEEGTPVRQVVEDVRDVTPEPTGLSITGRVETPRSPIGDIGRQIEPAKTPQPEPARTPIVPQAPRRVATAPDAIGDLGKVKPAKVDTGLANIEPPPEVKIEPPDEMPKSLDAWEIVNEAESLDALVDDANVPVEPLTPKEIVEGKIAERQTDIPMTDSQWLYDEIRSRGGIAIKKGDAFFTEYSENLPKNIRASLTNKNGLSFDEMADELGMSARQLLEQLDTMGRKGHVVKSDREVTRDEIIDELLRTDPEFREAYSELEKVEPVEPKEETTVELPTQKEPAKPTDGLGATKEKPKKVDVLEGVGKPKAEQPTEAYTKASSFISRISKGEPATLDEVKAEVEHIFANEEAITAELKGMTNKELDKLLPWTQRGRYKKKDELVDAVADNLLTRMYYEVSGSNSLTIQSWGRGEWKKEVKQKIQDALDKHTPETWEKLQADNKKEYEEALAKRKERLEGVKTPKTLDDFRTARQLRKLTPEEQDTYEDLLARDKKSSRLQRKQMDAERKADKASAVLEGDRFTITKDKHTKTGEDVWIVKLNERVDAEEWKSINASMKSLGGSWWRGNQGWNFKSDPTEKLDVGKKIEAKAEAKQESNATKLRKVADNMQKSIDEKFADRLANTARRARMANNATEEGERLQRIQRTLRNIADGIESGEVELISNIDSKAQIETLERILHLSKYNKWKAEGEQGRYEEEINKPYTVEDIRYAKFPVEEVHVNTINSIISDTNGKKGYMQIAARFKKAVANAKNDYVQITGQLREDLEKVVKAKLAKGMAIEDLMQERKRLERMGIESEGELRAYLREYINYRGEVKIDPNKAIREKERALIGTKIEGYFPTPKPVVDKMLDAAEISEGMDILEPSAGKGNIADAIGKPDVIEIVPSLREILTDKGHNLVADDFMEYKGKLYDRIVMNPPFEKGQDIDHVRHAYELLKPGGRIVAIMSEGPFFRSDKKATAFREWLDEVGYSEKLPEGSFKTAERSTGVNARMVVIDKPVTAKISVLKGVGVPKKTVKQQKESVVSVRQDVTDTGSDLRGYDEQAKRTAETDSTVTIDPKETIDVPQKTRTRTREEQPLSDIGTMAFSGKRTMQAGETITPSRARQYYEENIVPEGWYVHGRSGQEKLSDYMAQATKDWNTAKQYAGKNGSMWMFKANKGTSVMDATDSKVIDEIAKQIEQDCNDGTLPISIEDAIDGQNFTEIAEQFNPKNIVDSAGAFDNPEYVEWLWDKFEPDMVITEDGAVVLNANNVDKVKVAKKTEPLNKLGEQGFSGKREMKSTGPAQGFTGERQLIPNNHHSTFTVYASASPKITAEKMKAFYDKLKTLEKATIKVGENAESYEDIIRWALPDAEIEAKNGEFVITKMPEPSRRVELFYRAVMSPEQAKEDLRRGYSYHQPDEYTEEQLEEMEVEYFSDGGYAIPLEGLCGFNDPGAIVDFVKHSQFGPYIAVYEGRYAGDVYDGDLFKPRRLLEVTHEKDFNEEKWSNVDPLDEGERLKAAGYDNETYKQIATTKEASPLDGLGVQGFSGKRQMKPTTQQLQAEPVRKKDIIDFLSDKLDIPVRVGKITKRGVQGIFKVKPEVIRTKLAEDIEVTAHEVGHYLDKKLGLPGMPFDVEMKRLAKGFNGDVRQEGTAQFMNYYLTNPAKAKQIAPKYYEAFQEKMKDNPEIADVLEQAQAQIKTWLEQPAKARVLGSLSVGEGTPKRPMTLDRLYTMFVDELYPLEKAVKEISGGNVGFEKNPFYKAWLSRGWRGKAETMLHYGVMDENLNKVEKSLNEILQPVEKRLDDFRAFIASKRVIELNKRNIETGIDPADAKNAIREMARELGKDRVKEFNNVLKELVKFQDATLEYLVKSGMLSSEAKKQMREMNRDYVPFYRIFDETGTLNVTGKTFGNLRSPVKKMKGSTRTIVDPLESIIKNTYTFINLAERNEVGKLFVELAERFEGSGKWIEKLPAPKQATKFQLSEIERVLTEAGVDTADVDLDAMAAVFRPSSYVSKKDNQLTVYRNGKPEFYQLDPELYRAFLFLDKESTNILSKLFSFPTSVLRAGATLTPEFMARNPARDQFSAFINSKYGFIPVVDLIRGLAHVLKKDDLYWKWYQSGGAHSAFVSVDRDYLQKNLNDILKSHGAVAQFKKTFMHPLEVLRGLSELTEEATRVQEFAKGLKKEGVQGAGKAALASRDLTVDFSRAGTVGKEANKWIAFLNAQIQDMDKIARQFKAKPFVTTAKVLLAITLPSFIIYAINKDNDWYKERPRWEKDTFWLIPYGEGKNFIRIPKPFTLGILFGTIPERFMEYVHDNDPRAFDELWETVRKNILFDMAPDKDYMGFPPGMMPTALVPVMELWANKSTFSGYDIVPQREQGLAPEMQYNAYTSETAKLIGKVLDVSPRKVDHLVYGYTAGLGRNVVSGLDGILHAAGIGKNKTPTKGLADIPLVKGFMSKELTAGQSTTVDYFYDLYNETEELYKTLKAKKAAGEKISVTEEEAVRLKCLKEMRNVAGYLSDMRGLERQVLESSKITPQEKKKTIEALDIAQINYVRKKFGMEPLK